MSHHKSTTIVVRCPDDRYSPGEELEQILREILALENAEIHYAPNAFGGALEFVVPETQTAWLWRFKIAGTLSPKIDRIIIVNHTPTCGAVKAVYGEFATDEAEAQKHKELLQLAADFIRQHLKGVHILGYLHTTTRFDKIIDTHS
jgi:hypothetical protein